MQGQKDRLIPIILALALLLASCSQPAATPTPKVIQTAYGKAAEAVYPGETWQQAKTPEELGWSSEQLAEGRTFADRLGSAAVMIVHDGIVVDAWGDVARNYICHSVRKSLLSALYGIYVTESKIDLSKTLKELGIDDKTPLTEAEKQATVADLLKARSGVYIPAVGETDGMQAARPERGSHAPGTFWYYNNWDFNTLGTIFDQETGEENIYQAFKARIADPIGMQDYPIEDLQYDYEPYSMHSYYGFLMSARDLARFGLLFARGGRWKDEQIIPTSWVTESTTSYSDAGPDGGYGYMWWVAVEGNFVANVVLPDGSFSARGYRGQYVLVIPEWDVVIVHRFDTFRPQGQVSGTEFGYLVRLILAAGPETLQEGSPDTGDGIALSEAELTRLVGQYTLSHCTDTPPGFTPPQEASIELYGEDLVVVVPGEVFIVLVPVTPTHFLSGEDASDHAEVELNGDRVESVTFVLDDTVKMVYKPKE
jgi:CubicO group peptidase (beta-lactamase class C family)